MDLSDVPFGVPVILHNKRKQKNLQNPIGTKKARCLLDNRDVYEQMILHRQPYDNVAIQSVRNGRFLHVRKDGGCVFESLEITERCLFSLETDSTCSIFFVSSYMGNVLHCTDENIARCGNQLRELWEEWIIMEPRSLPAPVTQALPVQDRQQFLLELLKNGKTVDEVEEIVTRLYDAKAA